MSIQASVEVVGFGFRGLGFRYERVGLNFPGSCFVILLLPFNSFVERLHTISGSYPP